MGWTWTVKPKPERNNTRIITKFLLFPKTIGNRGKWLMIASYIQKYRTPTTFTSPFFPYWEDYCWSEDFDES